MSPPHETIRIAHTARCKLSMAANAPDRNFRFILGHALTLDKMMLRIAEIELDSSDDDGDEEGVANDEPHGPSAATATRERRVSFSSTSRARHDLSSSSAIAKEHDRKQRRSPPPTRLPHPGEEDDDDDGDDDDAVDDDEEDNALSLQRFPSATAQPPRMVADNGDDEGYDDPAEPVTPTDEDVRGAIGAKSNEELTEVYQHIAGCPCHGKQAPMASQVWEMPRKEGHGRLAVMQVVA